MTSKKHQGVKEYVEDPAALTQYMQTINSFKTQAEAQMGTQFGPQGTNGHLSAKECGRVGGAITKSVFLSLAGASMADAQITQQQQAVVSPGTRTH